MRVTVSLRHGNHTHQVNGVCYIVEPHFTGPGDFAEHAGHCLTDHFASLQRRGPTGNMKVDSVCLTAGKED